MLVHDLVKIKLIKAGYLPNYPYHLISDIEMCDAFMCISEQGKTGYFYDTYPCLSDNLIDAYNDLEQAIYYYISKLRNTTDADYLLPDWVYAYMLGSVISVNSGTLDIHDLISPMGVDNIDDIFDASASHACYKVSKRWLQQTQAPLWSDDVDVQPPINLRPPTMFGEPHVIKCIRLSSLSPI